MVSRSPALALALILSALLPACRLPSADAPEPLDRTGPLIRVDGPQLVKEIRDAESPIVVLNLWATWCGPCKEELPSFVEVGKAYREKGVKLALVSLDFEEELDAALEFLKELDAELPSYAKQGKDHPFIQAIHTGWSGALPATLIYGPDRAVRYFWEGQIDRATLEDALDTLLAEQSE